MMDRLSTSSNPLFDEQQEPTNFVTKVHLFGVQHALHEESEALSDRIELLATDLRHSAERTRDYFDTTLTNHMEDLNAKMSTQMEELCALMVNQTSSTSSSPRWRHSSRHSYDSPSRSSTPTSHSHRRAACQERQANQNPFHGNGSKEQLQEQELRHRQNQATLEQAQERQRQ